MLQLRTAHVASCRRLLPEPWPSVASTLHIRPVFCRDSTLNTSSTTSSDNGAVSSLTPANEFPTTSSTLGQQEEYQAPFMRRVKNFFSGNKIDREKLASLGFGAFSAYGVISNVNAGVIITMAWLTVVKTTGMMPTAPGNWPKFLAVYAGLWISSNFMRPIRLSLAIAAAPFFDKAISKIMSWTGIKNKVAAFVIMLAGIATGTIAFLGSAIFLCGGFVM